MVSKGIFEIRPAMRSFLMFLGFSLFLVTPSYAHKVTIFAWVDGDVVHTESKFSGGKKVTGGDVLVLDEEGNKLLEGITDDQGEFSFKIPKKATLKVVLQAGSAHRAEWTLEAEEMGGTDEPTVPAVQPPKDFGAEENTKTTGGSSQAITTEEIESAVEKALDRKLQPVLKMLARSHERGPSLKDILGGLGYILGLIGIATYVHYRRKSAKEKG